MKISRRKFIIGSLITAVAAGAGTYFLSEPNKHLAKNQIIIPGTATIDLDEMVFGCKEEFYHKRLTGSDIQVGYAQLKFDAKDDYTDLLWRHTNETQRSLVPRNGAKIAVIGKDNFDSITIEDLMSPENLAKYSENEIVADDDPKNPGTTKLKPGTVIGIKTADGNYAKMRIDEYLTLKRRRWSFIPGIYTERPTYNLLCTLEVFRPQA